MCHSHGHAWRGWGIWTLIYPDRPLSYIAEEGTRPVSTEAAKRRARFCERCGAKQVQDGSLKIIEGPQW